MRRSGRRVMAWFVYATITLGLLGGAMAWADGQCAIIQNVSCPSQFCDTLGSGRVCGDPIQNGTCDMVVCENYTCFMDSHRKTKVHAYRNTYNCVVGNTTYNCFGSGDLLGSSGSGCCDCP